VRAAALIREINVYKDSIAERKRKEWTEEIEEEPARSITGSSSSSSSERIGKERADDQNRYENSSRRDTADRSSNERPKQS
jgi:hypothetical protein